MEAFKDGGALCRCRRQPISRMAGVIPARECRPKLQRSVSAHVTEKGATAVGPALQGPDLHGQSQLSARTHEHPRAIGSFAVALSATPTLFAASTSPNETSAESTALHTRTCYAEAPLPLTTVARILHEVSDHEQQQHAIRPADKCTPVLFISASHPLRRPLNKHRRNRHASEARLLCFAITSSVKLVDALHSTACSVLLVPQDHGACTLHLDAGQSAA
eukprot:6210041-Pleurochrysis_carterae.AAC.3